MEQEIDTFKKENIKITNIKKKLQADKDKLAKELAEFETLKETEKKKIEEDKRRIKRDKMLVDKGKRDQQKGKMLNYKCLFLVLKQALSCLSLW